MMHHTSEDIGLLPVVGLCPALEAVLFKSKRALHGSRKFAWHRSNHRALSFCKPRAAQLQPRAGTPNHLSAVQALVLRAARAVPRHVAARGALRLRRDGRGVRARGRDRAGAVERVRPDRALRAVARAAAARGALRHPQAHRPAALPDARAQLGRRRVARAQAALL